MSDEKQAIVNLYGVKTVRRNGDTDSDSSGNSGNARVPSGNDCMPSGNDRIPSLNARVPSGKDRKPSGSDRLPTANATW
jgi:hypothetical protein